MTGEELAERKIVSRPDIICVLAEGVSSVRDALPALLLDQMVGHVGCYALAPVSRLEIDVDAVSPIIVEQFMRI